MELFTYLMAKNDHNTSVNKDLFSYLLGKNQSGTYTDYSGTSLSINNTKKGKMKLTLKGNTSQYTTTGKNLLNQSEYISTRTTNAVKFTNNGDGTFNVSGTASASFTWNILDIGDITLESGKTYTLYSSIPYNGNTFNLSIPYKQDGTQKYLTANNSVTTSGTITDVKLALYIPSGTNVSVTNVKLMLVEGSTAGDYEPYTGGASPNPSYPQDVHIVSGDNTINICGKNLFNIQGIVKGRLDNGEVGYASDVSNLTLNEDSFSFTTTAYWRGVTTDFIKVKENTDYFFSSLFQFNANDNIFISACYDENKTWLGNAITLASGNYKRKFTTVANTKYVRLNIQIKNASTTTINNPQLEETEATTYEPYQSQSYAVNLGELELCKIGDYQDYIYKEGKKWYKYGAIGKVIYNGTESWTSANNSKSKRYFYRATVGRATDYNVIADTFTNTPTWTLDENIYAINGSGNNTSINIMLGDTSINTTDQFKTWLSTHNTTAYYVLATQTTTEITDTTLISQLDELESAMSYKGQTNISQINNDLPFNIDAKIKVGN